MITQIADNLYEYRDGDECFYITIIPETIVLYGTPGKQFFKNPHDLMMQEYKKAASKDKTFLRKHCELHTTGVVNKDRMVSAARALQAWGTIDRERLETILQIAEDCKCTPPIIKKKLTRAGLGEYVRQLDFEDDEPALTATLAAMSKFLDLLT